MTLHPHLTMTRPGTQSRFTLVTTVAESPLPRFYPDSSTDLRHACVSLETPLYTIPSPNSYEIQIPSMSIVVQEQLWISEMSPHCFCHSHGLSESSHGVVLLKQTPCGRHRCQGNPMNPALLASQGLGCTGFAPGVPWVPCKASLLLVVRNPGWHLPDRVQASCLNSAQTSCTLSNFLGSGLGEFKTEGTWLFVYLLSVFLEPPKDAGVATPHIPRELHSLRHYLLLCSKNRIS